MQQFASFELPIAAITAPTLVIHGTEDNNVPFAHSEALVEAMPQAEFFVVEGGDHYMPFSHSEEINAAIEEFLRGLQPSSN